MEGKQGQKFDKLAELLLSDRPRSWQRVTILRRLLRHPEDPRLKDVLVRAAALPTNAPVLKYIVRSFGYLVAQDPIRELEPFFGHPKRSVLFAAIKAGAAHDRERTVHLAAPAIRRAKVRVALAAAKLLLDRCGGEARGFFESLAFSRESKHRLTALVYLQELPASEAVPLAMEMIRRERHSNLHPFLSRLLAKNLSKENKETLRDFQRELLQKAASVEAVLDQLPSSMEIPAHLARLDGLINKSAADLGRTFPAGDQESVAAAAADVAAGQVDAAALPGPVIVSAPITAPERRTTRRTRPIPAPLVDRLRPYRALFPAAVVLAIAAGWFAWTMGEAVLSGPEPTVAARRDAVLGKVGSSVRVEGKVIEVDKAKRTIVLVSDGKTTVTAIFTDLDAGRFPPGSTVSVEGVLREIRSEGSVVVQGFGATSK